MSRPTQMTISLDALRHNVQQIRRIAPNTSILAMVKANAYGHGLVEIAADLNEVDGLGVACLEEGLILRQAGIQKPIVLIEGIYTADELADVIHYGFTLVIHREEQVAWLEACRAAVHSPISVWLKIDTGMHRLGVAPNDAKRMYQRLSECTGVKKPIGLMTHFADADSTDRSSTEYQIALFSKSTHGLEGPRSLANSAGILAWHSVHADWVRPGIMLYGVSPFVGMCGHDHHLRPVMSLHSELIAVKQVEKGGRVGYGGIWVCPETMPVGVVGIGYGDGYPRHAKNGTPVLVNGHICPLIGRVSMDMLTVDLRSQPNAKVGDSVILWGESLPVEKVAEHCDTTAYELLTRMTPRVPVNYRT